MKNTQPKHKNPSQTQQQTDNQAVDSITEVHLLGAPRKSVSFKCNEKLWKSFVSQIRAQGLSVCHILEPMIYGWLQAKVHLSNTIRPVRIENLVVERAVKRVRRYAVECVDGVESRRFYCGLRDAHVPRESLPLFDCGGCPNVRCREFVFGEAQT